MTSLLLTMTSLGFCLVAAITLDRNLAKVESTQLSADMTSSALLRAVKPDLGHVHVVILAL